jgi:hypothetical protein
MSQADYFKYIYLLILKNLHNTLNYLINFTSMLLFVYLFGYHLLVIITFNYNILLIKFNLWHLIRVRVDRLR